MHAIAKKLSPFATMFALLWIASCGEMEAGDVDDQLASAPTGLASSNITSTGATLSWSPSTDNVGVTGYEAFRDGTSIGTTATTLIGVTGLSPSSTYAMTVRARDAAGNWSDASAALDVTTEGSPTGPLQLADAPTEDSVGPTSEPTITYTGSCTVTQDNLVIDNKIVNCPDGLIMGNANGDAAPDRIVQGVLIRNSVVNGGVFTDTQLVNIDTAIGNDNTHPEIFRVESSRLLCAPAQGSCRGVGMAHFTVVDSLIRGTHSGGWVHNKGTILDSFITTTGTSTHQSGIRVLKNSTLRGNTIWCKPEPSDPAGGNCSGDAVFYREFGVPSNLTIERNYWKRDPQIGHYYAARFIDCHLHDDCLNIRFTGNLFDLNQGTDAGEFPNDAGDVWSDNWWTDGVPALLDQSR